MGLNIRLHLLFESVENLADTMQTAQIFVLAINKPHAFPPIGDACGIPESCRNLLDENTGALTVVHYAADHVVFGSDSNIRVVLLVFLLAETREDLRKCTSVSETRGK